MKTTVRTTILLIVLFVCGILVHVSCRNDTSFDGEDEQQTASLTLTVNTENNNELKTLSSGTKAVGTPLQTAENLIVDYSIFVFYPNGALEKSVTGTSLTQTITGLTAGQKRIVVLANEPSGYGSILEYADIENEMIDLDTQDPANLSVNGLAMSGDSLFTLVAGSNTLNINISRIVAKIQVGGIAISADLGHDASKFQLTAVHIMKAMATANMGIPVMKTGSAFYGGTSGTVSTAVKTYLTESISIGDTDDRYFYVFPNDNTSGNATMLAIEGTYDGVTTYFSFYINDQEITPGDGTGEFVKRNTVHTINVTLKKLNGGTTDPEQVADPATLDISILPEDWIDIPDQAVIW